jgi:hypothetical protein
MISIMPAPDDALIKRDLRNVSPISALDVDPAPVYRDGVGREKRNRIALIPICPLSGTQT